MNKLNKEEKFVILTTFVIAVFMIGAGFYFKTMKSEEPYQSNISEISNILKKVKAKENICIEVFEEISNNPSDYFNADQTILDEIKIDISEIDNQILGTYKIKVNYQKYDFEIPVKVVDTKAPVLKTKHNNFTWTLEENETVKDVMEFVGLVAEDNYDGILTDIEWLKELPSQAGKETYPIKVKDKSGNISEIDIVITYELPNNEIEPEVPENEE